MIPSDLTANRRLLDSLEQLLLRRPVILQLLRFVAIGILNTTLDFLILNFLSKSFGISAGIRLGTVNIAGFSVAVVQSYLWNRAWTFGEAQVASVVRNFIRLVLVGGVGFSAFVAVLLGARLEVGPFFYLLVLLVFVVAQILLWSAFGLRLAESSSGHGAQIAGFLLVSLIGLLINSSLVSILSGSRILSGFVLNPDLLKNLAKILATGASLIWNFVGYKFIVFKR